MKRYFLAALMVILLIAGTNYWVDPAGFSDSGREQEIAMILLSGKHASVPPSQIDFEERRLLRELAQNQPKKLDTIAFGSSRFRYVTAKYLNTPSFFNHSINAATFEDLTTLYWYYRERDLMPRRVLLSLDPWMIDQDVSYVRLINLAYGDDFVRASRGLGLTLTDNDREIFASQIYALDKNPNMANLPLEVDDSSVIEEPGQMGAMTVAEFVVPEDGEFELSFEARITPGTYYYRLAVLRGEQPLLEGDYLGPLDDDRGPSVHDFRRFRVPAFDVSVGEKISILMDSATGDGQPAPGSGQSLQVRDVSLLSDCPEGLPPLNAFGWNCLQNLASAEWQKLAWISELLSPAYFQQSLSLSWQKFLNPDRIRPIDECVAFGAYTWCADGSVSPPEVRKSVEEVDTIVRTVDDGVVPLLQPDPTQLDNLSRFIDLLREDGVEVQLFLMPLHPFTYQKWRDAGDQKGFDLAERIYRDFALEKDLPISGAYNPLPLGMGPECFRDWVHPYPECLEQILDQAAL